MSIPTSFNPLGTLGAEVPYVNPLYNNDASLLLIPAKPETTAVISRMDYNPNWKLAFRGLQTAVGSSSSTGPFLGKSFIEFTFSKPVKVTAVKILGAYMPTHPSRFLHSASCIVNDEVKASVQGLTYESFKLWTSIELQDPEASTKLKLELDKEEVNSIFYITSIEIEGTYRP